MVNQGGGCCLIKVRDIKVQKISMKYFCIIKEKIAYMEYVIQSSMFYSFNLFLSILLFDVDSALVSDLNAYIWNSNCIQMFELYSNVRIYIWMLKECVFSTCSWKMTPSDDVEKHMKEEGDFFTSTPILFKSWNFIFYGEGGEGSVCAEHEVTQEGSREQTWQSVTVRGR